MIPKYSKETLLGQLIDLTNQVSWIEEEFIKKAESTKNSSTIKNAGLQMEALREAFHKKQAEFIAKIFIETVDPKPDPHPKGKKHHQEEPDEEDDDETEGE